MLNQPTLSSSDIYSLISHIGIVIEKNNIKKAYKTLIFYRCWFVHDSIDRQLMCAEIIEGLTDILICGKPSINSDIYKVVGLEMLRSDLINFCKQFSLPDVLFSNDNNWKKYLSNFVQYIIKKPISFPKNKNGNKAIKKIFDSLQSKSNKNMVVEDFTFVDINNILHWQITTTTKKVKIIGQLSIP